MGDLNTLSIYFFFEFEQHTQQSKTLNHFSYNSQGMLGDCVTKIKVQKYLWLSEQKPDMFSHKLKFILLPQLIATLNN